MPTDATVVAKCSFCRKANTEVAKLVAGPGVFICDECIDLATQVIAGAPARRSLTWPRGRAR